jgi:chromosome segregation ATPase
MSEDLTRRFDGRESDEKLSQILTAVQNLDIRLGRLEEKVEHRLYDTRPIWEKVQTDLAQLQAESMGIKEGQQRLEQGQELLRGEVRDIKTSIRDFNCKFSIFNDTLVTMQADYRDIYDRIRDIERQRT